jgi:hypothetical protein
VLSYKVLSIESPALHTCTYTFPKNSSCLRALWPSSIRNRSGM